LAVLFGGIRNFEAGYTKDIRVVVPRKASDDFRSFRLSIFTPPWSYYVFEDLCS
jgi:hypothetical protein